MNKISCYNGILYKIEYKPELSQKDYTLIVALLTKKIKIP